MLGHITEDPLERLVAKTFYSKKDLKTRKGFYPIKMSKFETSIFQMFKCTESNKASEGESIKHARAALIIPTK